MIELKELRAGYGDHEVVAGADLKVAAGEIVAVIGANGSGKTTLLDAASGYLPVSGIRRMKGRVGRAFQDDELFPSLTVREAIDAAGGDDTHLARFGLVDHADRWPHELSTGIRRVVEIALVTAQQPDLLLLDEPSAGLAAAEVVNLAEVIRRWRDESGGAVLMVEHDTGLVKAVADRVLELRNGRLGPPASGPPGLASAPLAAADLSPKPLPGLMTGVRDDPPPTARIPIWRLARWGLRELAAGALSVMVVGVLNRVMAVELDIPVVLVSLVVGAYNLAAPLAIPVGHRSDTRPLFGRRRSGYIVGGAALTGLATVFAPDAAHLVARSGSAPWAVALAIALFAVMGVGMYGSGTAFFAFLADQCPPEERSRAAAVVYSELMLGVLAGVALTTLAFDGGSLGELRALFLIVAVGVVVLSTLAIWGSEEPVSPTSARGAGSTAGLRASVRSLTARPEARGFFAFLFLATVALFLQQSILEPFGGEVLGLSVERTTGFNAVLIVGVLLGMGAGARGLAPRLGFSGLAAAGMVVGALGFAGLAIGAMATSTMTVWISLAVLGLGTGLFNVAGLSMMMALSTPGAVGLAMGAWTLAHALADGLATAGGGAVYDMLRILTGGEATGFAAVFALEGAILLGLLPLLSRLSGGPAGALLSPSGDGLTAESVHGFGAELSP
jgi:MFS transporter, BCD family, chlorophyll transporter